MGLFSRKPKADAAQFCRAFYDSSVFVPDIGGIDPHLQYCRTVQEQIAQTDPSFRSVDLDELAFELLALRLEVTGTAWSHKTKVDAALAQSEFTKAYLSEIDRDELWDQMGEYNQIVAQSADYGVDGSTGAGRMRITMNNQTKTILFDGWAAKGHDTEAAARVANRTGTEAAWKSSVTQSLLALELAERLGHGGTDGAVAGLATVAEGYYRGASESLYEVKITF